MPDAVYAVLHEVGGCSHTQTHGCGSPLDADAQPDTEGVRPCQRPGGLRRGGAGQPPHVCAGLTGKFTLKFTVFVLIPFSCINFMQLTVEWHAVGCQSPSQKSVRSF